MLKWLCHLRVAGGRICLVEAHDKAATKSKLDAPKIGSSAKVLGNLPRMRVKQGEGFEAIPRSPVLNAITKHLHQEVLGTFTG